MKSYRGRYVAVAAAVILLIIAIVVRCGIRSSNSAEIRGSTDEQVEEGQAAVSALGEKDVASVESEISQQEKQRRAQLIASGDLNAIFADAMIMGDSQMEGMSVYKCIDASHVAAVKGHSLTSCDDDIKKTINMSPSYIFMNYGMNDAGNFGSDTDKFIGKYEDVIGELQESLPSAKIIICSIFPAQAAAIQSKPSLAYIPAYNKALSQMCDKLGLKYVDATSLFTANVYEPDHIHTNAEFHKTWLKYVANESGMLDD